MTDFLRRKLRALWLTLTDRRELIADDEIGAFLYVSRKESEKHREYLREQQAKMLKQFFKMRS